MTEFSIIVHHTMKAKLSLGSEKTGIQALGVEIKELDTDWSDIWRRVHGFSHALRVLRRNHNAEEPEDQEAEGKDMQGPEKTG